MADSSSVYCPSCHTLTHLTSRASIQLHGYDYEISECNGCNFVLLVKRSAGRISEIFPDPLPKPVDKRIPENIKKDFEEALRCFAIFAYRASSVMARRSLQSICLEKGAKEKDNLEQQIDWLYSQRVITRELQEWAHEVRYVGNNAAHPSKPSEDKPVVKEDAQDILDLLEQFTQVLFVAPAIAGERKKVRESQGK